ncbi:MAG: hypothetical protein AAF604_10030 [Acidobacteriota bacterium]
MFGNLIGAVFGGGGGALFNAIGLSNLGSAFLKASGLGGVLDTFTRIAGVGQAFNLTATVGQGVLNKLTGQNNIAGYGSLPSPQGLSGQDIQGLLDNLTNPINGLEEILGQIEQMVQNFTEGVGGFVDALLQLFKDKMMQEEGDLTGSEEAGGSQGGEGGESAEGAAGSSGSGGGRPATAGGWGDLRNHPMVVLFSRGVEAWESGLKRIADADPSTPEGMQEIFLGQAEMNRGQNAMTAASNTLKALHATIQAITQNIPKQNA